MPTDFPTVTRRGALVGAAALALLAGTAAVACAPEPPVKEVDALLAQLDRAQDDGQLATAAAAGAAPPVAAALTVVAAQRAAHAKALTDEVTRVSGEAPSSSTTPSPTTPTTSVPAGPAPKPPSVAEVVASLRQSATGAALLASQQSGYRAGLLGSHLGGVHSGRNRRSPGCRADPVTSPSPDRPTDAADAALFDAIAGEHAAIYGYGLVSAHSTPDDNYLVSGAIAGHRELREEASARLTERKVTVPVAAAGYRLPFDVTGPIGAARLAVRMEEDSATAWRAVLERATSGDDRELAVTALTRCAVMAARWRGVLGVVPATVAFPGGNE